MAYLKFVKDGEKSIKSTPPVSIELNKKIDKHKLVNKIQTIIIIAETLLIITLLLKK